MTFVVETGLTILKTVIILFVTGWMRMDIGSLLVMAGFMPITAFYLPIMAVVVLTIPVLLPVQRQL